MSGPTQPDLEALQRHIGEEHWARAKALPNEPVRMLDILQYTEATEDSNPLWRDREYAQAHGLPDVAAPPGLVEAYAPNYRAYHYSGDTEYLANMFPFEYPFPHTGDPRILLMQETVVPHRPVHPGDTVIGTARVENVEVLAGTSAGRLVVTTFDKAYTDAEGEAIANVIWRVAAAEQAFDAGRVRPAARPLEPTDATGVADRASKDALTAEQSLPVLRRTVTMTVLVKWAAVLWDMGVPHFDAEYSQRVYGLPTPLANGPLLAAYHRAAITDWVAPQDKLEWHEVQLRGPVISGETVAVHTRLDGVQRAGDGETRVSLRSEMRNEREEIVSLGRGSCLLLGD